MNLEERINLLVRLGDYLQQDNEAIKAAIGLSGLHNKWFTRANCQKAISSIATNFLGKKQLEVWAAKYPALQQNEAEPKIIGLVLPGNIPAVGFHDILTVFLAGHRALIKYSDKDKYLIPLMIRHLTELDEGCKAYFVEVPMLKNFDAVIATGSNNSATFFDSYFSKYPHIIRRNRNSVAVLEGKETEEDIQQLGKDIFRYFGLGCRSISKIYLPRDYDLTFLMRVLDNYKDLMDHNKYHNNFDYNRSIYLLNQVPHLANDCIMLLEDESLLSRIATLHYEYYDSMEDLQEKLTAKQDEIQCIASNMNLSPLQTVSLGNSQSPALDDYADGIDTIDFLCQL